MPNFLSTYFYRLILPDKSAVCDSKILVLQANFQTGPFILHYHYEYFLTKTPGRYNVIE